MNNGPSNSTPAPAPIAARGMWLIALLLSVGALSLATAALPGRARPLFLLPLAFGVVAAALSIALRRSLSMSCSTPVWLVTAALALGGYGQVVVSLFQQYSATNSSAGADEKALIAIQMLQGTEHQGLADSMQKDLEGRRNAWNRYLNHRYAALGQLSPVPGTVALAIEALLVIAGVGLGRRLLDSRDIACHAKAS